MSRLLTELGGQTANRIPDSTVAVKMSLPHWPQRPIISLHRTAVQDMWSCQRLCHLTCRVPLGLCGPRPSDDNVAPPPKSAGYSDCSERGQRSEVRGRHQIQHRSRRSLKSASLTWHQLHCSILSLRCLQTALHLSH